VRVDPVLAVAFALLVGSIAPTAPLSSLAFVLGAGAVVGRRLSARTWAVVALTLALAAVRSVRETASFEGRLEATRIALGPPSRCFGVGRVESSPVRRNGAFGFVAAFESIECEGKRLGPTRVRLYGGPEDLVRADSVELTTQIATVELFRNAELPDPTPPAARADVTASGSVLAAVPLHRGSGLAAAIDRLRARARIKIDRTFVPLAAPLARALVLGENDLSVDDGDAFRASGLSHLLAVSGTHLVFAVLGIVHALGALLARVERLAARRDVGRLAAAFGVLLAPLYADFAGGSGSAQRAAWMLVVGLGARALGRRPRATRAFALSIFVGAAFDPLLGFDVSFVLSVAATGGLLALGRPLAARVVPKDGNAVVRGALQSLVATLSAMAPCAPLLATLGPTITVAGIFANVVAAPFGEIVALPLCLVHVVAVPDALAHGIALVASGSLLVVRFLARSSAAMTLLAVPVPPPGAFHFVVLGIGGVGAMLAASGWRRRTWLVSASLAVILVEAAAVRAGHPHGVLRVTVLDVGQGDSTLVDFPDGSLMLVDGGGFVGSPVDPGARVILPLLRVRRRARIDVAVLSHPHPDHYLGLATTLHAADVGELWDTGQGRAQGAGPEYHAMLAELATRHVPVRGPEALCYHARSFGKATVTTLSPCPSFDPVLGANDNSFVLRVRYGERAALLVGDAEHETEERLLGSGVALRADLLKGGHHGSRTSTSPEWLSAVQPAFVTLSCGVRNRFGHPHPMTLETLRRAGVPALRTDRYGSVEWTTDGHRQDARVFANVVDPPLAENAVVAALRDLW
jgi:competence protein ComEC